MKECIFSTYQSCFSFQAASYCRNRHVENSDQNFSNFYQTITDCLAANFKLTGSVGNNQNIRDKVIQFGQLLCNEVAASVAQIEKGFNPQKHGNIAEHTRQKLDSLYRDIKLMNSSIPSFKLLTEIFEELAGIPAQIKGSNYGWAAKLEEARKEQSMDKPSSSSIF